MVEIAKSKLFSPRALPVPKGIKRRSITVKIRENVTSAMSSAAYHTPIMLEEASLRAATAITLRIRQAYFQIGRGGAWFPLTAFTIKKKAKALAGADVEEAKLTGLASIILRESGALDRAVLTMRPSFAIAGKTFVVNMSDVDWPTGRGGFPYVFAHEFGVIAGRFRFFGRSTVARRFVSRTTRAGRFSTRRGGGLPRRGFIREGLVLAGGEVSEAFGGAIGTIRAIISQPSQATGVQITEISQPGLGAFRVFTPTFFLFAFLPPTILLSYIGLASDIVSLLKFSFTSATTALYVRSYALGQFGLTPKTRRRQFRRRLYAGQYR